jgi:hypothetical protein
MPYDMNRLADRMLVVAFRPRASAERASPMRVPARMRIDLPDDFVER